MRSAPRAAAPPLPLVSIPLPYSGKRSARRVDVRQSLGEHVAPVGDGAANGAGRVGPRGDEDGVGARAPSVCRDTLQSWREWLRKVRRRRTEVDAVQPCWAESTQVYGVPARRAGAQ